MQTTTGLSSSTLDRKREVFSFFFFNKYIYILISHGCKGKLQSQKVWENVTCDWPWGPALILGAVIYVHLSMFILWPLLLGGFLLYWVYIFGSFFINQFHFISKNEMINFLWCSKVGVKYHGQENRTFSQTLQAQSVASGEPGGI